jgi:hypothetical protein
MITVLSSANDTTRNPLTGTIVKMDARYKGRTVWRATIWVWDAEGASVEDCLEFSTRRECLAWLKEKGC